MTREVRRASRSGLRIVHTETLRSPRSQTLHVVALHGGPGFTGESLRAGLEPLAATWPVTLIDLPGCGRSSRHPGSGYPMNEYVHDVRAVLDAIGATRILLVGHAWGAMLATAVALADPERVDGVVMVNPLRILNEHGQDEVAQARAIDRVDPTLRTRFAPFRELFLRARDGDAAAWDAIDSSSWPREMFATQFAGPVPPGWRDDLGTVSLGYESYDAHKGAALQDPDSEPGRRDLCNEARRVTQPVLIVASTSDANYVAPPAIHARPLADAIARCRLVEFDGLGHFLCVEAPEQFAATVVHWAEHEGLVMLATALPDVR